MRRRARAAGSQAARAGRAATGRWRALPDLLIAGAQKSGTTSLFQYLRQHPGVVCAHLGEVHYLDDRYDQPLSAYRAEFPLGLALARRDPRPVLVDKSPKYLFHPHVPARAAQTLPGVRAVVLLRDPVERAISHHRMNQRAGNEPLDLGAAIEAEAARIGPELELVASGHREMGSGMSATYSYVARGLYADQLDRWAEHLPRERMLVRRAEDLFERPGEVYADVLDFAGLAPHAPEFRAWHSAGGRAEVDPAVRAALERAFEEPNRRLAERWGISWP